MRFVLWCGYKMCDFMTSFVKVKFVQSVNCQQMHKVFALDIFKFEVIGAVKQLHEQCDALRGNSQYILVCSTSPVRASSFEELRKNITP